MLLRNTLIYTLIALFLLSTGNVLLSMDQDPQLREMIRQFKDLSEEDIYRMLQEGLAQEETPQPTRPVYQPRVSYSMPSQVILKDPEDDKRNPDALFNAVTSFVDALSREAARVDTSYQEIAARKKEMVTRKELILSLVSPRSADKKIDIKVINKYSKHSKKAKWREVDWKWSRATARAECSNECAGWKSMPPLLNLLKKKRAKYSMDGYKALLEVCAAFLEAGADPNLQVKVSQCIDRCPARSVKRKGAGNTALHLAARNGFLEICELLLSRGTDPHIKNARGNFPVEEVTYCREVEELLKKHTKGWFARTFGLSTSQDEEDKKNDSSSAGEKKDTPTKETGKPEEKVVQKQRIRGYVCCREICEAASNLHTQCIKYLLDQNAEVNTFDSSGRTPLQIVAAMGYFSRPCELLPYDNETRPAVLQVLIARGADANIQDLGKQTPLHYAAKLVCDKESLEVIKVLLRAGADVSLGSYSLFDDTLVTPYDLVFERAQEYREKIDHNLGLDDWQSPQLGSHKKQELVDLLKILEEAMALLKPGPIGWFSRTFDSIASIADKKEDAFGPKEKKEDAPKAVAAPEKKEAAVQPRSHAANSQVSVKASQARATNQRIIDCDRNESYPCRDVANASRKRHVKCVQFLLDRGSDVNNRLRSKMAAIHYAVDIEWERKQSPALLRLLISRGAKVNDLDGEGRTPLHCAAHSVNNAESLEIIRILLHYGADVSIKNKAGDTAYDVLCKYAPAQKKSSPQSNLEELNRIREEAMALLKPGPAGFVKRIFV